MTAEQEARRKKPRVSIVLRPEVWAAARRLAAADKRSLSGFLEGLIVEAEKRFLLGEVAK